jgi:two-component system chemotaxis sensor kinase CheA
MGAKSVLDSNFDYEIVDEFLDHYSIMIDCMESMILDLRKQNMFEQSINELFRVFHNIKSSSAFLQLAPMSKLAAFVESVLDEIRTNKSSVNEETINWLLDVSDMFALWRDDLRLDNELTRIKYSLLKLPDLESH